MQAEFDSLEKKVAQFIALCERLRVENTDLRQQIASVQRESKHLADKIEVAKLRIEQLLLRLPE